MKRFLAGLCALAAMAIPAMAQQFDGVWYARQQQASGVGEYQLTIVQGTYALTSVLTTPQGYQYQSYQSGSAEFIAPETLRLMVFDWQPREYNGVPMSMPPNSNLRLLGFDGQTMTLLDNVCAMSAPPEACATTYRRMQ